MGTTRDDFIQYPRTPHLFGSKGTDDDKHLSRRASESFTADYNARVEIVYLEPPLRTILIQNQRRTNAVPDKVIDRMMERLESPKICSFVCVQGDYPFELLK